MPVDISGQLMTLTASLVAGGGIGLLFDLVRPLRSRGFVSRFIVTALMTLLCLLWLFLTGRWTGEGTTFGFLCGTAAGICFYLPIIHPMMEKQSKIIRRLYNMNRNMQESKEIMDK